MQSGSHLTPIIMFRRTRRRSRPVLLIISQCLNPAAPQPCAWTRQKSRILNSRARVIHRGQRNRPPLTSLAIFLHPQDFVKGDMEYLDDGRPIFRLRLRLCSTIHPTNERLQAFHVAYDRHMLGAGGPPSSALLTVSV